MRRREFIAAAATLAAPLPAQAQSGRARPSIGFLHSNTLAPSVTLTVLRRQWSRLGYVEGETVLLRSPDGDPSRLPAAVAELIAQRVAVIIAVGAAAVRAAAAATKTVPIVAVDLETNPIAAGLAASYARPGGNVTGVFMDQPSMAAKWLELLREAAPRIQRVAFIWDPSTGRDQLDIALGKASERNLASSIVEWPAVSRFDEALADLEGKSAGLVALTAPGFGQIAGPLGRAAQRYRLPAIVFFRAYLVGGLLMSYGPDQEAYYGRVMPLVERILAGESPGALPIELPTRFDLSLDMRTARAIGVTMPLVLLAQADEVIE